MFTGLLKQFLKNITSISAVSCTVVLLIATNAQAGHSGGLHIDDASWDGSTLTADGGADKPNKGGGPVEVFDADTDVSLGLANLPNSGNWSFSGSTCADNIYVTQDAVITQSFPVSGPDCGGVNTPPTANDDNYNTTTAVTLNVSAPGVLGNDTDDGLLAALVVSNLVSNVSNGTLNLNTDGSFDYTSNPGFTGDDTFTYEADDGEFQSTATVTITVDSVPTDPQCSDGIDNDGDGLTDFPADPGCDDANDDDETDAPVFQCSDGIDNDGDGLTDFPADPGCDDANDDDETDAQVAQCSDGIDNDGDNLIDFPDDPGCVDANDNDEADALPPIDPNFAPQTDFKIMMNYELGIHFGNTYDL